MSNEKKLEGASLTINLEGKLDAHSAEALAEKIKAVGPEAGSWCWIWSGWSTSPPRDCASS